MASLSQLATNRLSISQIWQTGLLNTPLPPQQLQQLQNRITLNNLYQEGLLNEDLDPALFSIAIQKVAPNLLWPYIGRQLNRDIYYPESPFSQSSEDYVEKTFKITPEAFRQARQNALGEMILELQEFLTQPGLPNIYGHITIVWSQIRHPEDGNLVWKFLIIYDELNKQDLNLGEKSGYHSPVIVRYYNTLDEVIAAIYIEMDNNAAIETLIDQVDSLSELQPDHRIALDAMRNALQAETQDIWDVLEEGIIILENDFRYYLIFEDEI